MRYGNLISRLDIGLKWNQLGKHSAYRSTVKDPEKLLPPSNSNTK